MPKQLKAKQPPLPHHSRLTAEKKEKRPPPQDPPSEPVAEKKKQKHTPSLPSPPLQGPVKKKKTKTKRSSTPSPPHHSSRSTEKKHSPLPPPSRSTKKKKHPPPPPPLLPGSPSHSGEEDKSVAPPSDSTRIKEKDEDEGSENEDSNEEESSSDSEAAAAAVATKPNPSNSSSSSDSGSEDSGQGNEEETSSSKSERLPPQLQTTAKDMEKETADIMAGSVEVSVEGNDRMGNDEKTTHKRSTQIGAATKPVESHAQFADRSETDIKQTSPSPALTGQKTRSTSLDDGEEVFEGKKVLFKRLWSSADELLLLRAILDYKERHHVIPNGTDQAESILNDTKDSLSISATQSQMYDKIRRMKMKYNRNVKRVISGKISHNLNDHDAAVFVLSRKIWGTTIEEPLSHEVKASTEVNKGIIKQDIGNGKQFHQEYPSLYRLLNSEYLNFTLTLPLSDIPIEEAKELDGNCKKLEIMEIQLHMERQTTLGDVFKLFENAHAKNR